METGAMAAPQQTPQPSQPIGLNTCDNGNDKPKIVVRIEKSAYQGKQQNIGYVPGLTLQFETLGKILEEQKTKANGTVLMVMSLPANLVIDDSIESGKVNFYPLHPGSSRYLIGICQVFNGKDEAAPEALAKLSHIQNTKNYEVVVLTWGGDSDFHQQQSKCVLHDILSGTQWKISKINPLEARNCAEEDGEWGNRPMESAEGEQSASHISGLKQKLETLEKALMKLRTEANGAVRMEMPFSAMAVDSTHESSKYPAVCDVKNYEVVFTWGDGYDDLGHNKGRKCPAVCAQQAVKNYDEVVLTMGEDSDSGQKRRKCVLHDTLFETNWKISKTNLPEAVVPMESTKGQQSKGKGKA